jgi:hypothetical protein
MCDYNAESAMTSMDKPEYNVYRVKREISYTYFVYGVVTPQVGNKKARLKYFGANGSHSISNVMNRHRSTLKVYCFSDLNSAPRILTLKFERHQVRLTRFHSPLHTSRWKLTGMSGGNALVPHLAAPR